MSPTKKPFKEVCTLQHHIAKADWDEVKGLLQSKEAAELLQFEGKNGNLPLHLIVLMADDDGPCTDDQLDLIKMIAKSYPKACKIRNDDDNLPIHIAMKHDDSTAVMLSLATVWPECLSEADNNGKLPFDCFLGRTSADLDKALELYPDGAKLEQNGILPIHGAAINKKIRHFKSLARAFPDGLRATDSGGNLPYHYLAESVVNHGDLQMLIKSFPDLLKHPNKKGKLPIQFAARSGNINGVQAIAAICPESFRAADSDGNTCFHHLVKTCPLDCRWFMASFTKLVDMYPAGFRSENKQGLLPIDMAFHYVKEGIGKQDMEALCEKIWFLTKLYPESILPRNHLDPVMELLKCKLPQYMGVQVWKLRDYRHSLQLRKEERALSKAKKLAKKTNEVNNKLMVALEQLQQEKDKNGALKRKLDTAEQGALEVNDVEETLLSNLISSNGASCSLGDMKTIAKSLQTRFATSNKPPSICQMMLPSLLKDDDAKKDALVQVIEALKKELSATESITVATTPVEDTGRNNKRPRVSISPSH